MNTRRVNKPIQVALVEDDPGVRASLAALLDSSPGFQCQAAYADGLAALKGIPAKRPDVVLMDINLPGMLGTEGVSRTVVAVHAPKEKAAGNCFPAALSASIQLMAWRGRTSLVP